MAMFLSSPAIYGERVYGATCVLDPIGGNYGMLVCLDAGTGKVRWKLDSPAKDESFKPFFSSPALTADGKYLVIGQGLHDDADSYLVCVDAQTGKLRWRIKTPLHIEGSPAVHGDMVVAGAGAIEGPDHKPMSDPGFLLAVRISDGKELWRYRVADPESSPAIAADGTVYIGSGFNGNAIVALRSETDEQLAQKNLPRLIWRTPATFPIIGAITLADDMVIAAGGNGDYVYSDPRPAGIVMVLDARSGQVRWQKNMEDAVLGAVACRDGVLICPIRNGHIVALSVADGKEIWRQAVSGKSPVLAAPAFARGIIYAVSRDGYLAAIDARNTAAIKIERIFLNDEGKPAERELSFSSPMVAGGRIFVGSETGGLRCYVGGKVVE